MNEQKPISFAIDSFRIQQFATIPGCENEEEYQLAIQVGYGVDVTRTVVSNTMSITFQSTAGSAFIIVRVEGLFYINPSTWDQLIDDDRSSYVIPIQLARHLAILTTGTLRGVLLARLLDSAPEYSHFVLPTVNLTELINQDTILPLEEE